LLSPLPFTSRSVQGRSTLTSSFHFPSPLFTLQPPPSSLLPKPWNIQTAAPLSTSLAHFEVNLNLLLLLLFTLLSRSLQAPVRPGQDRRFSILSMRSDLDFMLLVSSTPPFVPLLPKLTPPSFQPFPPSLPLQTQPLPQARSLETFDDSTVDKQAYSPNLLISLKWVLFSMHPFILPFSLTPLIVRVQAELISLQVTQQHIVEAQAQLSDRPIPSLPFPLASVWNGGEGMMPDESGLNGGGREGTSRSNEEISELRSSLSLAFVSNIARGLIRGLLGIPAADFFTTRRSNSTNSSRKATTTSSKRVVHNSPVRAIHHGKEGAKPCKSMLYYSVIFSDSFDFQLSPLSDGRKARNRKLSTTPPASRPESASRTPLATKISNLLQARSSLSKNSNNKSKYLSNSSAFRSKANPKLARSPSFVVFNSFSLSQDPHLPPPTPLLLRRKERNVSERPSLLLRLLVFSLPSLNAAPLPLRGGSQESSPLPLFERTPRITRKRRRVPALL